MRGLVYQTHHERSGRFEDQAVKELAYVSIVFLDSVLSFAEEDPGEPRSPFAENSDGTAMFLYLIRGEV